MKKTISFWEFCHEFEQIRPDNFTDEGLRILFDYLEEIDEDMELDVIGFCCEFTESYYGEIADDYDIDAEIDVVRDFLHENTILLADETDELTFVYVDF